MDRIGVGREEEAVGAHLVVVDEQDRGISAQQLDLADRSRAGFVRTSPGFMSKP